MRPVELAAFAITVGGGVVSCTPPSDPLPSQQLERLWPEHRALLDVGGERPERRALAAEIPARLNSPIELLDGARRWRVHEAGCGGAVERIGSSIAYDCSWGNAIWRPTSRGAEEWLIVSDPSVLTAVRWRLEGGRFVQHGRSIDVYDDYGAPRLTVSALAAFDSAGRTVGARLRAGGDEASIELDGDAHGPILVDPAWVPAGLMALPRSFFSATLLTDGRVLATGGVDSAASNVSTKTAELWDPGPRTWSAAAPMAVNRSGHSATLLLDGTVLVAGGGGQPQRYDPSKDTWAQAGTCNACTDVGVRLSDGTVLAVAAPAAQKYDPVANTWQSVADAPGKEYLQSQAVLLANGKAFVFPVFDPSLLFRYGAIYDPKTDAWAQTPPPPANHSYAPLALLSSGRVLAAGGDESASSDVYDPVTNKWTAVASMATAREMHTAATLPDGTVIEVGGRHANFMYLSSTEIYDETTNKWTPGPYMAKERYSHQMPNLGGGKLLAVGGQNEASSELFGLGKADGAACQDPTECVSGFCVDGVCCDKKCDKACWACTFAKTFAPDGTCFYTKGGTPCDADGSQCTVGDACTGAGECKAGKPIACNPLDQCHDTGTCDPKTGKCSDPTKPDGASCDDGDACTIIDICQVGACIGTDPVKCPPDEVCYEPRVCDHAVGVCFKPDPKPKGTPCDDGDPCTTGDSCNSGKCVGVPVECAIDQCHQSAKCSMSAGQCVSVAKADGTSCDDGDACTVGDSCQGGACVAGAFDPCGSPTCQLHGACKSVPVDAGGDVILNGRGGGACSAGGSADPRASWVAALSLAWAFQRRRRRVPSRRR